MEAFIKFGTGLVAVVALVLGFTAHNRAPQEIQPPFGSVTGPNVGFEMFFMNNITVGGTDFATSSQGSVTYTAASVANSRVIEHIATAATTATLPTNAALSAAGFLPNVGDTKTVFIHASTTAITLAGNTGLTLFTASSTKNIAAGSVGELRFVRLGATEGRLIVAFLSAD